jgi:hypothetical protein
MKQRYVVVVIAADGTLSVMGTASGQSFTSAHTASKLAEHINQFDGMNAEMHAISQGW